MEWEIENIAYFGKPIEMPDMSIVYREMKFNPEGVQPRPGEGT